MPDIKLEDLPVLTAMATGDKIPFTSDPSGSPLSKNITRENFFKSLAIGSDADGDMYYRAAGVLARIAKGTAAQALVMNSGATAPEWGSAGAAGTRVNKDDDASPYAVTAADLNGLTVFTNTGADAETIFQLPAGDDGYIFRGLVTAAYYMQFLCDGAEKIRFLGTQTAAGGYIRSNVIGNMVQAEWSGTEWVITGIGGPWTYDS